MADKAISIELSASQRAMYREVRFTDGRSYPCMDRAKLPTNELLQAVTDREAIAQASSKISSIDHPFGACYVMGIPGEDKCKIGYSRNPSGRRLQIEGGLWGKVEIFGLFWSYGQIANGIEQSALREARKQKIRLKGEWVNVPPEEAAQLILSSCDISHQFTDSATFSASWLAIRAAPIPPSASRQNVSWDNQVKWARMKGY